MNIKHRQQKIPLDACEKDCQLYWRKKGESTYDLYIKDFDNTERGFLANIRGLERVKALIFQICGEFEYDFQGLQQVRPADMVFGPARFKPNHAHNFFNLCMRRISNKGK